MLEGIKRRKKSLIVAALCVVVAVAVVFTGAMPGGGGGRPGGGEIETTSQEVVVEVTSPYIGSIYVTGEFIGTVEPNQQVIVYPKVSGEVLAVNYGVGDMVEKGAVLAKLDSSTLESTIAQTQATLSTSEARAQLNLQIAEKDKENYVEGINEGLNSQLISAEASVLAAENNVYSAKQNLSAARRVYREARNGDSDQDYSDQGLDTLRDTVSQREYALESAQLTLEQAEASLEAVKKAIAEQADSAENSVALAELNANFSDQYIALNQLQKDLEKYTITAPISGVIEQRGVSVYDMASTQTPMYVISNKDAMTVSFNVAESNLQYLQLGDSVSIDKNGQTCTGFIAEISTMVDSSSGLFTVKAIVLNPTFELHSGSTVKIYASTRKAENDLMVPIDSIYYEANEPFVYVYQDGKAVKTFVETGISDTTSIQILSGLPSDVQIISTWSANLMDGTEVVVRGAADAASAMEESNAETPAPEAIPEEEEENDGPAEGGEEEEADNETLNVDVEGDAE